MQKRVLGKTGLECTLMGMGGFHLLELPSNDVTILLNDYLDRGGNYIETAEAYGDGLSESKVGQAVSKRRKDFILATKCGKRTYKDAQTSIQKSLERLKTDTVDILFMHAVQTRNDVRMLLSDDGALRAAEEAREKGQVRFIGITGHGYPDALYHAIQEYPFDVLMTGFNYYDRFNFPFTEEGLLPTCLERGIGVMGMKALADGYLYRSVEDAIRYTLSLPITTLVLGVNTPDYLEWDWQVISNFTPLTEAEKERLFTEAVELGAYVCRQCKKCDGIMDINPSQLFLLEGIYDRQMDDGTVPSPAAYALRERLKHWFAQTDTAREHYNRIKQNVDPSVDYSKLNDRCPYHIDVDRKLRYVHSKLGDDEFIF